MNENVEGYIKHLEKYCEHKNIDFEQYMKELLYIQWQQNKHLINFKGMVVETLNDDFVNNKEDIRTKIKKGLKYLDKYYYQTKEEILNSRW